MEPDERQLMFSLAQATEGLAKTLASTTKTLEAMAATVESNGVELAALRLTTQALFATLSRQGEWVDPFAAALIAVMEADEAVMLNTRLSDDKIAQRRASMLRLLPPNVLRLVKSKLGGADLGSS